MKSPSWARAAIGLSIVIAPAAWADNTATKSGGGDWFDDTTWTNGIPSGLDYATIWAGDTVTIQKLGAGASLVFNSGIIDVRADDPPSLLAGRLSVGQWLAVGVTGAGLVRLSSGGSVFTSNVSLGYNPGWDGIVTVDGAPNLNGDRSVWANSGEFHVGGSGFGQATGTVMLANGATVTSRNTFIGVPTSTGRVDVNNSTWTNSNLMQVGDGGVLGTLSITNHGVVNSRTGAIGGGYPGSTGSLTDALGTAFIDAATWNNSGDFYVGTGVKGQLNVVNGGLVTSTMGYIGYGASSVGTATFSNSTWSNAGDLIVGAYGDGTLLINDGATVTSSWGTLGRYDRSKGAVTVDNASWTVTRDLIIGHGVTGLPDTHAYGELVVRDGGRVSSATGFIGYGIGSTGRVEVKGLNAAGTGSTWAVSAELHVGESGLGVLTISDGGIVKSPLTYLGPNPSRLLAGGTLNLDGTAGRRGVLETGKIIQGDGAIFFNGGILRATADQPSFLLNVSAVNVGTNGAFIDSNGHNIGIDTQFTGPGALTKLGLGTLDLRGLSFLGGLSSVDVGKLLINGRFSGDIQVSSGATLGGSGEIIGAVTVLPGGILSPGSSPGTLAVGSLTLGHQSHLIIELGALSDLLTVNGNLTLDGIVDFIGDPAFFASGALPSFISYSGSLIDHGIVIGLLPDGVDRDTFALNFSNPGFVGLGPAVTAVPEPSTTGLLGLGFLVLLGRRRFRRNQHCAETQRNTFSPASENT